MFTGIVEERGVVRAVARRAEGLELTIKAPGAAAELAIGGSVAVDGVCLTAEKITPPSFTVVAAAETLASTTLQDTSPGRRVHLELPLRIGDRLGGHLVQGHVDGVATVTRREIVDGSPLLELEIPAHLTRYLIAKGSITVDGVSLTINGLDDRRCDVLLVPHTVEVTHLADKRVGDRVNLEVDMVAKYIERLHTAAPTRPGELTLEKLEEHGYVGRAKRGRIAEGTKP